MILKPVLNFNSVRLILLFLYQRSLQIKLNMKIDCYISEYCSSEEALRKNVMEALRLDRMNATVNFHTISEREAQQLGLLGSPSLRIDGKDILPGTIPGFS